MTPGARKINMAADRILDINQDAMVHKSDRAARRAIELERLVVAAVLLGLTLGLLASAWLTTRLLRPLGVVAAAVRRFGRGTFARARASGVPTRSARWPPNSTEWPDASNNIGELARPSSCRRSKQRRPPSTAYRHGVASRR